jgi:hypothetical protein
MGNGVVSGSMVFGLHMDESFTANDSLGGEWTRSLIKARLCMARE